jgi:hypothetical protein
VHGSCEGAALDALVLRSILRDRGPIRVPNPHRGRQPGHWSAAVTFVGHLATTAFVFLSLVTFAGGVSFVFSILKSTNLFSADALQVFGLLESVLIRLDAAACGIVLLFGIGRYVLHVIKGDS